MIIDNNYNFFGIDPNRKLNVTKNCQTKTKQIEL
jgi:hypothetical protein